jgi:apolipoprotein N-acyltransferase
MTILPGKLPYTRSGVTWWPQPAGATASNAADRTEAIAERRNGVISSWTFGVALAGALLIALAFPKTNATVLAPLGATGLFWAWFGSSPRRALFTGWAAGVVFFSISFSWFGETAGALIAPFGFLLTLGPAIAEGLLGFGLAGALVALVDRRAPRALVPPGAAAAFALCEWFRSEGLGQLGVPFAGLGLTQVSTPFAALASYVGSFGVTFALCLLPAYVAYALRFGARQIARSCAIGGSALLLALGLAWLFWPARFAPPASTRVAAVQGNIAQTLKFRPETFGMTLTRYTTLTNRLAGDDPAFVLWPETVIPAEIDHTPWLRTEFGALARRMHTTLIVGAFASHGRQIYNALYFFGPTGTLRATYVKRQLVPFAEHLPFKRFLTWIPWAKNVSDIGTGSWNGVTDAGGVRVGPIVCWESAFSNINVADVRSGAQALLIATDDAWFGTTDGPYQHAQIAQMRAIETGRWVVRAAATGISGIIAPDGRYTRETPLDRVAIVRGEIGKPVDTFYDSVGSYGIAALLAAFIVGITAWGRRTERAS